MHRPCCSGNERGHRTGAKKSTDLPAENGGYDSISSIVVVPETSRVLARNVRDLSPPFGELKNKLTVFT
jgi:hypothetical protein